MPLLAHLSEADIRRYVAGRPSLETERHVKVCVFCMQRLSDGAVRETRWERRGLLRRLVRVDPSRVVDELLSEIEKEQRQHAA